MKQTFLNGTLYHYELKGLGFSVLLLAITGLGAGFGEAALSWLQTGTGKICMMFLLAAIVGGLTLKMLYLVNSILTNGTRSDKNS